MRSKLTSLIFVASCFLSLNLLAFADSQARIVRLSYIEGNVQLDRGDGSGYIRAFLNMPLIEGTSLLTKDDGRAEVEFEDGSTIRLTPNTIINFTELRLRDDGSRSTLIALTDGATYFNVKHDKDDLFRLTVGPREIQLAENSHFRVVHSAGQDPFELRIAVFKGQLRFIGEDGQRVGIRKNETLTLDFNDQGRYFLAKGMVEETHDYWDKERDEARDRAAMKVVSDQIYLADLYRHGTFITVNGYGSLWRPLHVNISWDPFSRGSWVYYPGAGYIFVSDYSWGWTPYRYGSWVHVNNYGWCWRPTNNYRRWAGGPVIVNAPRGYVPPVAPIVHDRPNSPVVRIGRLDSLEGGGRPQRFDVDGSGNAGTRVVVQDRINGEVEVDRNSRQDSWVHRRTRDIEDRNSLGGTVVPTPVTKSGTSGGVTGEVRTGEAKTGGRRRPEGEGIDARRLSDDPVRDGTPIGGGTPAGGVVRDQVVTPPVDRPARPQRFERTEESTRPVTPPVRVDRPADSPVVIDRPSRPTRNDSPPPRIDNPPVRQAPIMDRPASPPPQRMSSPPAAPPARPAPVDQVQPRPQRDSPQ